MSYEAIICRITTSPHPNADKLQLADAAGYTCIVSIDHVDGELGIVFPEGGQLVHEFCMANTLYRKHPETGEPFGGYLEANRRIKALKLRGVESDALWLPISAIGDWLTYLKGGARTGVPVFAEGDKITEVKGHKLCGKYYTPATIRAMQSRDPLARKTARKEQALAKHYDTPQLRTSPLPAGRVIISEKVHGTSGRTGHVEVEQPQRWITRWLNKLPFVNIKPAKKWELVSGTRNCILDTAASGEKAKGFRFMAHEIIEEHLAVGEVWYYELVGFEDNGRPIMSPHHVKGIGDSKLEKQLAKANGGESIVYHYGYTQDGRTPDDVDAWVDDVDDAKPLRFKILVYRITLNGHDLTWDAVVKRVNEVRTSAITPAHKRAFLDVVPVLETHDEGTWMEGELRHRIDELTRGPSMLGPLPLREGVCVRIESTMTWGLAGDAHIGETITTVHKALKHKGFVFCALEGIRKNDPDFVDEEEVS